MFQKQGISINEQWNIDSEQQNWLGLQTDDNDDCSNVEQDSSNNNMKDHVDDCSTDDSSSDEWTEDPNFESRLTGNTDTLLHPYRTI